MNIPKGDYSFRSDTYAWGVVALLCVGGMISLLDRQVLILLVEPINPRDMPGYLLNRQDEAHEIVTEVGEANLKVQMDLYHCQVVEGDVAMKLRRYLPTGRVGHLQIAGVPQRHEPDLGELNYPYLFSVIDELGYDGWIGCEYRPLAGSEPGGTSAGLGWMARWR